MSKTVLLVVNLPLKLGSDYVSQEINSPILLTRRSGSKDNPMGTRKGDVFHLQGYFLSVSFAKLNPVLEHAKYIC